MVSRLQSAFFANPSKPGVLLRGGPGSGKSTIARAYIASHNGHGSRYPGGTIWLAGNTVESIMKSVRSELFRFNPPASTKELGHWFRDWLAAQPKRWLLVVDDVGNGSGVECGASSSEPTTWTCTMCCSVHALEETVCSMCTQPRRSLQEVKREFLAQKKAGKVDPTQSVTDEAAMEGGGATDRVLRWVGHVLPGRTPAGGHVLVTTRAASPPHVPWLQVLKVVVVPPLTQGQAVLAMWRYVQWFAPATTYNEGGGIHSRPRPGPPARGSPAKPQRHVEIPAGVLAPELQYDWGDIPELVAELWAADHGGIQQRGFVRALVPGAPSDPVAMADSQRITLLQWITRLLLMRPQVPVEQLRRLVKGVELRLANQLHAWAYLPAAEAVENPTAPRLTVHARLLDAISDTVRLLSGSHDSFKEDLATQLSLLRQHQPDEFGALCDLVARFVLPASTARGCFVPRELVRVADAVIRAGANFASFLAACQSGTQLRAGYIVSGPDDHSGAGAGAGAGAGSEVGAVVDAAFGTRGETTHGDGGATRSKDEESAAEGWVQVTAPASNDDGESSSDTDWEDSDTGGATDNEDGSGSGGDRPGGAGGGGAGAGGAGGSGGSGSSGDGTGGGGANPDGGRDGDAPRGGNNATPPDRGGRHSQGGCHDELCATAGEAGGVGTSPSDNGRTHHADPVLLTGPIWPPSGMRIVALHGQRGDGMEVAAEFAGLVARHYAGGVFVLEGQSTTAMWRGIRRVVLSKALCSDAEGAELSDMAVCDLFLKWLADVRPLCLFVVTNVGVASSGRTGDSVASRCGAFPWLLSRLRNTSNLHVLFTTTASRAAIRRVAPVVATISLESYGDHQAEDVMKLVASACHLPMTSFSGLPCSPNTANSSNRGSLQPRPRRQDDRGGERYLALRSTWALWRLLGVCGKPSTLSLPG